MRKLLVFILFLFLSGCISDPTGDPYVVTEIIKHNDGFTQYYVEKVYYDEDPIFIKSHIYYEYGSGEYKNKFNIGDTLFFDNNMKIETYRKK